MERYRAGEWNIEVERGRLLCSHEILTLNRQTGIKIPQCFYGNSFVSFKHPESGFNYFISSEAALQLCEPDTRIQKLYREGDLFDDHINVIPKNIKIPIQNILPENPIENIAKTDWTFSSPYKGCLRPIYPHRDLPEQIRIQISDEIIPTNRLGQDNPILWSSEIKFYEDSLGNSGLSSLTIRVRAMQDCFYALLRCYIRIDNSLIRILDTRIFHGFETRRVIREFQLREASFDELMQNGFNFSAEWYSNPRQSDIIFQSLPIKTIFKDIINY